MVNVPPFRFEQCLGPFTIFLVQSKGTLRWYIFDIYLTKSLRVRNFGNTLAMSVTFFFENVPILIYISKLEKELRKKFFFFEINAPGLVALNSLYYEKNACYPQ